MEKPIQKCIEQQVQKFQQKLIDVRLNEWHCANDWSCFRLE